VGATYKGFNDTLAAWGSNRVMGQQCGQTWLQTFTDLNGLFNSGKQLNDLQLVTWNDYEEATEIESGIDNCFTVTPALSGNALQWSISGNENTVDHYTVYISSDGQNLMSLTDLTPGLRSLNLCGFPIPNGSYELFVQAVGKPTLANQMSGAVNYNSSCVVAPVTVAFAASPSAITIPAGQAGHFTVTAKPQSGAFNNPIALSCTGLASNLSCSFAPATITPGSSGATSTLTISAAAVTGMNLPERHNPLPIYAGLLLPFGIGSILVGGTPRRCKGQLLALIAILSISMAGSSCGGVSTARSQAVVPRPVAGSYSITIQGNAASSQLSTVVQVTVQ